MGALPMSGNAKHFVEAKFEVPPKSLNVSHPSLGAARELATPTHLVGIVKLLMERAIMFPITLRSFHAF